MNAKDMVLQDLPDLYPGLTRAGIEHVLHALDDASSSNASGIALDLVKLAPVIAERLRSLSGKEFDDYVRVLAAAAVLVLQMWTSNDKAPPPSAIATGVEAIES